MIDGSDGDAAHRRMLSAQLDAMLAQYGSLDSGFVAYSSVTAEQKKELSDQVNALSEPLSQLTVTVLE